MDEGIDIRLQELPHTVHSEPDHTKSVALLSISLTLGLNAPPVAVSSDDLQPEACRITCC